MSKSLNYGKKRIRLYYTEESLLGINPKVSLNIETAGSGEGKNYEQVEQEAQLYLIKDAISKKPKNRLSRIVGIMQDILYDGLELKISLRGIAVFE